MRNSTAVGPLRLHAPARVGRKRFFHRVGPGLLAFAAFASFAAQAGSVGYAYDALGRLASVVYSSGTATTPSTTTITYSYDAAGNRTSVATTSP
jgi:hypothetical protein